jgi:hypothetical protein
MCTACGRARHEILGGEDVDRMKLFWVSAVGLVLIGSGMGAVGLRALDAPRTLHHARTAEPRLT